MSRDVIVPPTGLRPGLPYSPAIRWDKLVFVSGQTGSDPVTREFPADIKAQTRIALENVKTLAEAGGASLGTALKMTIHMTDMMNEFGAMNEVFKEFFPNDPPSRTTVGVAHLARAGLKIEIDMIAVVTDAV
ncbi:RidA family protein [Bradyrhizobium sp. U87765 SZCCT0131]|uniref:RidA family protein n=1 Tax=unclassified Bradyrhizobium TaxID=2631580 RepID=UPI001BA63B52|nr:MULTISPECIES: RidA family protein [unclassified Bradyrhizobium]MBR1217530.1 RidA family protein [Bradyrhizobium sp. U87765 SZCCT0131]MBR1264872.1 RidA family protein [Bradyrhizobium sp. U87765 SZCCT0134]MBR1304854.1 RidA family protein [Bradyrhizobium sp. U87765 SZCCT0110]MBR1320641.1 RidA family protein [Bradyrhizobium sp. U87765 SZCCT0109]MBR1349061.1 RidA family protein [Bradyrhizobium sp. U87765 SZCCT0048]